MQSKKTLLMMIGLILVAFVFLSILASQLCHPTQNNAVVNAAVNTVAEAMSSPQSLPANSAPDPLSWTPIFQQLISFLSKACPP